MSTSDRRIPELDGLRGLAIALVIAFHFVLVSATRFELVNRVLLFGWSGVDLFFVLSGFLIGGILLEARTRPDYFSRFYARRAFRILPAYTAVLAVYGALWIAGGGVRASLVGAVGPPMSWYSYVSFTNNFWEARHQTLGAFMAPSWSLSIEEQFYLTLPLLVRVLRPRVLAPLVGGVIVVIMAARWLGVMHGTLTQAEAYVLPYYRFDALLIGVGCALLARNARLLDWLARTRFVYAIAGVLAVAVLVTGGALPPPGAPPRSALMSWGLTAVALFYASLLLIAVTRPARRVTAILRVAPLRWLGTISYAVYLLHQPLIDVGCALVGRSWRGAAVGIALALVIAQLSWTWFEAPMLRLGQRFRQRSVPVPATYGEVTQQREPSRA